MWLALLAPARNSFVSGLLIAIVVGIVSWYLGGLVPRLGSVTIAIMLGILVGNVLLAEDAGAEGLEFAEKKLLPIAIALLGVELQFLTLVALGFSALVVIVISIGTSIFISMWLGRLLGFSRTASVLMGAGNGICGASAIAATSIAIDADEAETGISIGVVNLLGTIGIFLVPSLIRVFSLSDVQGGLLVGGSLQAFGQAVAAGFSVNDAVGNIATVVKMGRVLMLGPVVILVGVWMQSKRDLKQTSLAHFHIPRFILGFLAMSVVASLHLFPERIIVAIANVGDALLIVAMAAIGMRIRFRSLLNSGMRSLLLGVCVSLIQITTLMMIVLLLA